jgi:hypothetical protein
MDKTKLTLGWLLIVTGTLFLICGLVILIFATLHADSDGIMGGDLPDSSFWITLANALMQFVIDLINIEWTPTRAGVFLIVVGLVLDGGGAYALMSAENKTKKPRRR